MALPPLRVFINEMGLTLLLLVLLFVYLFIYGVELKVITILFSALSFSLYAFVCAYYYDPIKDNKKDNNTTSSSSSWYNNIINQITGTSEKSEQLIDIIDSLKISLKHTEESSKLLHRIRLRLQKDQLACVEASKLGLLKYVLSCLEDILPNDIRMSNGIDIINQILHNDEAKIEACKDYQDMKEIVDKLIIITREFMNKTIPKKVVEVSSLFNDDNEEKLSNYNDDNNLNYDKSIFVKIGYKLIIALGLITIDSTVAQTCVGDKGGVSLILSCLKDFRNDSVDVLKWCYWALFHITLQNPPNKRELVFKDGITLILKGLKAFPKVIDINQQGIALLCSVLTDDPHSKMNLYDARQIALQNDIVDVLQEAQKAFKNIDDIQATSTFTLNTLISNWQF